MVRNLSNTTLNKRYQFEEVIGEGTFARVYRVHDQKRGVDLAAKVLREDIALDPTFSERFRREAAVLQHLQHPHIVRYYETVETDGVVFILLDYIQGETLQSYLARRPQALEVSEALHFLKPITAALSYAHGEGIVHRDMKPANVLLRENGQIFLTDFGIARMLNEAVSLTHDTLLGTPLFMSPEQILNKNITLASDIYAIGVMLYSMFTKQPPFMGKTPNAQGTVLGQKVAYEHLNIPPTPPQALNPDLSDAAQEVVMRCLRKEPTSRYPSAAAVYDALAESVGATPAEFEAVVLPGMGKPKAPSAKLPEWSQVVEQAAPPQNTAPTVTNMDAQEASRPTQTHSPFAAPPPEEVPVAPRVGVPQGIYYDYIPPLAATAPPPPLPPRQRRGTNPLIIGLVIGGVISIILLCILLVVLGGSFLANQRRKSTPQPTTNALIIEPSPTRRTTDLFTRPDTPTPPQVSNVNTPLPQGGEREFIYASDKDGNFDIYQSNLSGEDPVQLTTNPQNETGPEYSPDGAQIAYYMYRGEDGNADIWVMNADGSSPRQLTNTAANERVVAWSPDGELLAYHSNADGDYDIYLYDLASGQARNLTNSTFNDLAPAWSPDGTRIAFHSNRDGNFNEVFVMQADGTEVRQITDGNWQAAFPTWSPDGSRLAFHVILGQDYQLGVINADGSAFQYLFEAPNNERQPDWATKGGALIYMRGSLSNPGVYFTDLLSGETREVATNGYFPDWKP